MHSDRQSAFASDILNGLAQTPKSLSCKWFYDENGSKLFEAITQTREYYLTRVETRLLHSLAADIAALIPDLAAVIEPGSGSSIKTRLLLRSQANLQTYIPIDISEEFLFAAAAQLQDDFPALEIAPLAADFTASLAPLDLDDRLERLVFFPGSTIGNFSPADARQLLCAIRNYAGNNAWLLIGVDMTQNEALLIPAYNDAGGITAQFNRNLLRRANRELGADFAVERFLHRAHFDRREHRIEMHLLSTEKQAVHINAHVFRFERGETIHTENCYKYSRDAFVSLAQDCGWQLRHDWIDHEESDFGLFLFKSAAR